MLESHECLGGFSRWPRRWRGGRARPRHRRHRGFTLIELLVVISIIVLMVAILLPALSKSRATAQSMACLSNLKQLGMAVQMYCNDHDGKLPGKPNANTFLWGASFGEYLGSPGIVNYDTATPEWTLTLEHHYKTVRQIFCPTVGPKFDSAGIPSTNYGINKGFIDVPSWAYAPSNIDISRLDSHKILMSDSHPGPIGTMLGTNTGLSVKGNDAKGMWEESSSYWILAYGGNFEPFFRHDRGMNQMFADGHAAHTSGYGEYEWWFGRPNEFN